MSTDPRARRRAGRFVLEGPTALEQAIHAGTELEAVFVDADEATVPATGAIVAAATQAGVAVRMVASGVLRKLTDAVTSRGIAAIAVVPDRRLADIDPELAVLVLVGVADPGNLGTLLRSAEAAGFGAVLCSAGSVDPWSPKAVRASAGSVLRVPVICGGEAAAVLDEVKATGRRRVGTRMADAVAHREASLQPPDALVLGNEAHGIAAELEPSIDVWVRIPMAPGVESLNVAMAGTLLCFEVAEGGRRRG